MDFSSLFMMAFVWGVLLFYFLTPTHRKSEITQKGKIKFIHALKDSFVNVTFHKKAMLALSLLVVTLLVITWSHQQEVLYNEIHGIGAQTQSIYYTLGIVIFSVIIYLSKILGKTLISLGKGE